MTTKADYVRSQGQTRKHHCHWPGCSQQVPPAMWGCKGHWFKLPASLRARIWATYKPGRPALPPEKKLAAGPVRLTAEQKAKLQRIGVQRFRDWLDRVREPST